MLIPARITLGPALFVSRFVFRPSTDASAPEKRSYELRTRPGLLCSEKTSRSNTIQPIIMTFNTNIKFYKDQIYKIGCSSRSVNKMERGVLWRYTE